MTKHVIALASITYAQKAKEILKKSNINSKISRLRQNQSGGGCLFGLEIHEKDFFNAKQILYKELIRFTEVK